MEREFRLREEKRERDLPEQSSSTRQNVPFGYRKLHRLEEKDRSRVGKREQLVSNKSLQTEENFLLCVLIRVRKLSNLVSWESKAFAPLSVTK